MTHSPFSFSGDATTPRDVDITDSPNPSPDNNTVDGPTGGSFVDPVTINDPTDHAPTRIVANEDSFSNEEHLSTSHHHDEYPLTNSGRVLLAGVLLALIAGFSLAASLTPDPRGFGTHQSLGLPPCSFRLLLGIHCPSCGGTTCFAYFVRGEWVSAANANLSAFGLALACAAAIPWGLVSLFRGRLWRIRQPAITLLWIMGVLGSIALLQWGFKLAFVPM
ncbi:MAG: DUF2752 domain-containing protein [Planctomycetaceae bacterium]